METVALNLLFFLNSAILKGGGGGGMCFYRKGVRCICRQLFTFSKHNGIVRFYVVYNNML